MNLRRYIGRLNTNHCVRKIEKQKQKLLKMKILLEWEIQYIRLEVNYRGRST
jgi:hypothetical protein